MKIIAIHEFLALPLGVVYSEIARRVYPEGLQLKDRSLGGDTLDFYYYDLLPRFAYGEEAARSWGVAEGEPFVDDTPSRWGLCDESACFVVFEPGDLEAIRAKLDRAVPYAGSGGGI